ncbi:hypothetical protein X943_002236 [Babesia divergens]|uniref:Uncharacterized protein n=1 Tax=Babesia divergens TaxID=32595 RepID=A0AAD9GHH8_BABDI|nr:hypothetical protein X943_002236 [Babesia divergens]
MVKEKTEKNSKKAAEPKKTSSAKKKVEKDTKKATAKKTPKEAETKKKVNKSVEKKVCRETQNNQKKETTVKAEPAPSIFSKPGQKHITPPKGDGTRGFYESLYEANPKSVIAIAYCVEHGLFGVQKHQELFEKYQMLRKEGHMKGGSGAIRPQAIKYLEKSKPKNAKSQQ